MEWYSVKKRMPENGVNVLLLFPQNMAVGCYDEYSKCWSVASGDDFYTDVADGEVKPTHWQPLPAPPAETE